VAVHRRRLQQTAGVLATVDVLASLGQIASARNYCRPEMVDEPELQIDEGRHPVLDHVGAQGAFVPNDTRLSADDGRFLLITGPNMAGKSTYIRQVALMVLMAQMGSWVPARRVRIGIVDRIFARIGASDELSRGQSTFMVEMTEAARILNAASERSLVILDEIGRGTSTYDGISLAWAMVEHLHDRAACRTLFATHYHELTELSRSLTGVKNLNVAVREWDDQIVFLHKIVEGSADKSYGIHVARLAGVPRSVVERAKDVLAGLENHHLNGKPSRPAAGGGWQKADRQLPLFAAAEDPLLEEIRQLDPDRITPLDALARIKRWQEKLSEPAQQ
jgi:DNA mismatch repair protein MutS